VSNHADPKLRIGSTQRFVVGTVPTGSIRSILVAVQLWIFIVFVSVHAPKAMATIAACLDKLPKIDQAGETEPKA